MRWLIRIGLVTSFVSLLLFLSTLLPLKNQQEIIPFTTASGYRGTVQIAMPDWIFTGEKRSIKTQVVFNSPSQPIQKISVIGRLEAGFEELNPAGLVQENIQTGSPAILEWEVRTIHQAKYPGKIWLWIDSGKGEELIISRDISLDSRSYLGSGIFAWKVIFCAMFTVFLGFSIFGIMINHKRDRKNN